VPVLEADEIRVDAMAEIRHICALQNESLHKSHHSITKKRGKSISFG
jgi:hypothetical protein